MRRLLLFLAGLTGVIVGVGMILSQPTGQLEEAPPEQTVPAVVMPSAEPQPTPGVTRKHRPARPVSLFLPELLVKVPVLPIAMEGGVLTPPPDPQTVGWWTGAALADSKRGTILITGHTVHTGGGALDDLETMQKGDRVWLGTERGRVTYLVRTVAVLSKSEVAEQAPELFDPEGPARVVLVTCEDYDVATGHYDSNVVVTAYPVGR